MFNNSAFVVTVAGGLAAAAANGQSRAFDLLATERLLSLATDRQHPHIVIADATHRASSKCQFCVTRKRGVVTSSSAV